MPESIHAHEILRLIAATAPARDVEDLHSQLAECFGPEARFHTCSRTDLSLDDLLIFLLEHGKVEAVDGEIRVVTDHVCRHE